MAQKTSASFIIPSSNSSTTERRNNEDDKNSEQHSLYSFYKPNKNRASRSVPSRRIQSPFLDNNVDDTKFAEDDTNNNSKTRMQKQKPLPPVPPKSSSFAVIETHKGGSFLQGQAPPPLPTAPKPKLMPKGRSRTASSGSDAESSPVVNRLSKSKSEIKYVCTTICSDDS